MEQGEYKPSLTIGIPTKLAIHANTVLAMLQFVPKLNMTVDVKILPGKSNIDQSRSILLTNWYRRARDEDMFLFIDSDQTFTDDDIRTLIEINADVTCGIYSALNGRPACHPLNPDTFYTGESNDLLYGATGFMMIRRRILPKLQEFIAKENNGISEYYISKECPKIIPFFKQRLIMSETGPERIPQWLGEDYGFCWMVRHNGGSVKGYISKTIGHEVIRPLFFYPDIYKTKTWEDNTIVYYTGHSRLQWSPNDMDTKGMGGSEMAVVELSKWWTKFGYKVIVYGNCEEGIWNDVEYRHFEKFKTSDKFNILILWRAFGFQVLRNVNAKKLFIDLHDEPSQTYEVLLQNIEKIDKILVKSNYHKSLFNPKFHHKFHIIQNGLIDRYFELENVNENKNRKKLIYASSYDRGLIPILKWGFPRIKDQVPDAELHIYYGAELLPKEIKLELLPLLNQPGVYEHGRIGHQEMMQKKLESSIHYYTGCDSETDCISVKESVFTGCIPVVSNKNVFPERDYCLKVDGNPKEEFANLKAADLIVKLMTDDQFYNESLNKVQEAKNTISKWQQISEQWDNEVFK